MILDHRQKSLSTRPLPRIQHKLLQCWNRSTFAGSRLVQSALHNVPQGSRGEELPPPLFSCGLLQLPYELAPVD